MPSGVPEWQLELVWESPDGDEGGADLVFVSGVAEAGEDRIAILDSDRLHVFDGGDTHAAHGQHGSGPGEFLQPAALFRYAADTLVAYDQQLRRLSFFTRDGVFRRSLPVRVPGRPNLRGVVSDTLLVMFDGQPAPLLSGAFTDSGDIVILDARTGEHARVIRIGLPRATVTRSEDRFDLFPPQAAVVANGTRVCHTDGLSAQIACINVTTGAADTIRWSQQRRPLTLHMRDEHVEMRLNARLPPPFDRAQMAERLKQVAWPDSLPLIQGMRADDQGGIWVGEYRMPGEDGPARWRLVDSTGVLATIVMPDRFYPHQFTHDAVHGTWSDSFDVTRVRSYRINR